MARKSGKAPQAFGPLQLEQYPQPQPYWPKTTTCFKSLQSPCHGVPVEAWSCVWWGLSRDNVCGGSMGTEYKMWRACPKCKASTRL